MSNDEFDSLSQAKWIDRVCDEFERSWLAGNKIEIEPYLVDAPEPIRAQLLLQLIAIDVEYRRRTGELRTAQEYVDRFSELSIENVEPLFEATGDLKTVGWNDSGRSGFPQPGNQTNSDRKSSQNGDKIGRAHV